MSAELLRRAATLLKHSAGAAQIGPWVADSWEIYSQFVGGPWVGETLHTEDEGQSVANGAYIALMHPPVALALADWLEDQAVQWEKERRFAERVVTFPGARAPDNWPASRFPHALATARAILREPEVVGEAGSEATPKEDLGGSS